MSNLMFSMLVCLVGIFCGACVGALLMIRPRRQPQGVYDYQYCTCNTELHQAIAHINAHGYRLISVTYQDFVYTVFFWRYADG